VALFLRANPDARLSQRAVTTLLQITPAQVNEALQAGVGLGLITAFNDMDEGRCWRAGPRLGMWGGAQAADAPPAAARPAPTLVPPAPAAKKGRGGLGRRLPPLQLSLLKINNDVPLPSATGLCAKGHTKYDAQLDLLKADGMSLTGIHPSYKSALKKAIDTYLLSRPTLAAKSVLVVRAVDDQTSGVWRVPKGTPGTQKVGGRPAAKKAA
jgi:hypothetical protein